MVAQPRKFQSFHKRSDAACASEYILQQSKLRKETFCVYSERREYLVFTSYEHYFEWAETIKPAERHFHEIIVESAPQRLKFDIDAAVSRLSAYRTNIAFAPNISDKLARELASPSGKFYDICARIAETICDLFMAIYEYEPEFIVCESKDPQRKKYSRHLIIDGFYVSGTAQAHEFTKRLKRILPVEVAPFLDAQVNKRVQAFRLPGACKLGEERYKEVISYASAKHKHTAADAVITNVSGLSLLPDITVGDMHTQQVRVGQSNNADLDEIFTEAGLGLYHKFRMRMGNTYIYNREKPSVCEFCKRVHLKDNTLLLKTMPPTCEGIVDVHMSCRKYIEENSPVSRRIGSYIVDPDNAAADGADARPTRLERIIKNGVIRLGEALFVGCKGITYDEPVLRNFELCETLVVHAAMKMGKTKKLREYIKQYFPSDALVPPVIRFVSFRQTFSGNIKESFPDFVLYSDVKRDLLTHPRLIIQVESLHRLEVTSDPPDLLILDESESIFEQFESGLIRQFSQACAKFIYMLKYAKHVICMDANITSRTESILRKIREKPIYYHYNSHRNAQDYEYQVTTSYSVWATMMDKYLKKGKRIAVPASSLAMASAIADVIRRRHPDLQLMLYSSETEQSIKNEHFANVNEWWIKYDVIIYTPTVTAGVSFEAVHFDKIFGYFTDISCNDLSCIQMLGRIRDVKSRKIVLCIVATGGQLPTEPDEIVSLYYERRSCLFGKTTNESQQNNGIHSEYNSSGELILVKSPYFHIWVANMRARNLSKNDFAARLLSIISHTGAAIRYVNPAELDNETREAVMDMRTELLEATTRNKTEKQTAIANADDADDGMLGEIYEKLESGGDASVAEVNIIRKHTLRTHYKYYGEITQSWVKTYGNERTREIYRNLCMIGLGDELTLKRIQSTESAAYKSNMQLGEAHNYKDMKRKYVYIRHSIAAELLKMCGFTGLYDTNTIHQANITFRDTDADTNTFSSDSALSLISRACREFYLEPVGRLLGDAHVYACLMNITNTVINKMYGFTIKRQGPMAYIVRPPKFVYPGTKCAQEGIPRVNCVFHTITSEDDAHDAHDAHDAADDNDPAIHVHSDTEDEL